MDYFARIIPVIDLKNGHVVHAVAGQRDQYQPIVSRLTKSSYPRDIASAFVELGFRSAYVADLDAIQDRSAPDFDSYELIANIGLRILVDNGCVDPAEALKAIGGSVDQLVLGTESITETDQVIGLIETIGTERLIVSLDLKSGKVISPFGRWSERLPFDVAEEIIGLGVSNMIVLDLARVGVRRGPGTVDLIRRISGSHQNVSILGGGGVSSIANIKDLITAGCSGVLVSTALHRKTITPGEQST